MTTLSHPVFGTVTFLSKDDIDEFGDMCDLSPISFRGVDYPATLFYSATTLESLTPQSLDPMAGLVERLEECDAEARSNVPDDLKANWLSDRKDPSLWVSAEIAVRAAAAIDSEFGGLPLAEVTRDQFLQALKLQRLGFSLAPEGSDGAMLTLDYRILPHDLDDELIAAKFDANGDLIHICLES